MKYEPEELFSMKLFTILFFLAVLKINLLPNKSKFQLRLIGYETASKLMRIVPSLSI